jgi:hypothetical protein
MLGWILFGVSTLVAGLLVWYVRSLMRRVLDLAVEFGKLKASLTIYTSHLAYIYSLDTFHGEPIIQDLIEKSKALIAELQESVKIFDAIGGEEPILDDGSEESEEEAENFANDQAVRRN